MFWRLVNPRLVWVHAMPTPIGYRVTKSFRQIIAKINFRLLIKFFYFSGMIKYTHGYIFKRKC